MTVWRCYDDLAHAIQDGLGADLTLVMTLGASGQPGVGFGLHVAGPSGPDVGRTRMQELSQALRLVADHVERLTPPEPPGLDSAA